MLSGKTTSPIHEEGGADITIDDEETKEHDAEWKDNMSEEPADKSPTDDGGADNTTKEVIDETTNEQVYKTPNDGDAADTPIEEFGEPNDEPPNNTNNAGEVTNTHEEGEVDKTIGNDKEATENNDVWKDNKSEEPATESPTNDGGAANTQTRK
jgi:hypothetical protein